MTFDDPDMAEIVKILRLAGAAKIGVIGAYLQLRGLSMRDLHPEEHPVWRRTVGYRQMVESRRELLKEFANDYEYTCVKTADVLEALYGKP